MIKSHLANVSDRAEIIERQQGRQKEDEDFDSPEALRLPPRDADDRMRSEDPQLLVGDGGGRVDDASENESGDDEHEGGVELEDHSRRTNVIRRREDALKDEGPSQGVRQ